MYQRLICGILAALLPLLLAAPVFAQDAEPTPVVFCGDLAEEDCALLKQSTLAQLDLSSYAITMTGDFAVSGFPDLPSDPMQIGLAIDGRMALDDTAKGMMKELSSLQSTGGEDALAGLAERMPELVLDLYRGMDFDMSFTYTIPPELAEMIGSDSDVPMPETLTMQVRLLDGMMYVNMAPFRALAPELERELKADWIGIDYVGLMEYQFEHSPEMSDSMGAGAASGAITAEMMRLLQDYMTVERLDDAEVDGQQAAVFSFTPDLIGFFTSKDFQGMLRDMAAMVDEGSTSQQELDQGIAAVGFMAPMLFRDLTVEATSTIGLDDALPLEGTFNFSWDLSSLMQLAAMSDPAMAEAMGDMQPKFDFAFDATYSDFNGDMGIEAPEDVQIIPLDEMIPTDTSAIS